MNRARSAVTTWTALSVLPSAGDVGAVPERRPHDWVRYARGDGAPGPQVQPERLAINDLNRRRRRWIDENSYDSWEVPRCFLWRPRGWTTIWSRHRGRRRLPISAS